jgi:hypothetical protein
MLSPPSTPIIQKILVVDDSKANRRMAVRVLKLAKLWDDNNPPVEAANGKEALDFILASLKSCSPVEVEDEGDVEVGETADPPLGKAKP